MNMRTPFAKISGVLLAALWLVGCSPAEHAPAARPTPVLTDANGVVRQDLRFPCGETTCAGWLYLPAGAEKPPIVVMGSGFSGTRDVAMPVFAQAFAHHGLAAFAFDYRCFGASGGSPRQLVDPWKQLDDWRAALSFVRTLDGVDANRLALWGTSMGGGLVIVIGAEDPSVSTIIAQVPAVATDVEPDGPEVSLGWGIRLLFTAWADLIGSMFSDEAILIPAFAESGDFGMIVDGQSHRDLQPLLPAESTYQNAIAARSFTTFDEYNPKHSWPGIDVPTLLVATVDDRLAPFEAVERFAAANGHVTVETFEGGHFDVYLPPVSDWATEREARFLVDNL
jgi:pimeloyl-ACP methyl ester carboxylesterase